MNMADHPLKRRIENREIALGAWATIPSPVSSEIAGATGFDYVCVDMQHGLVGYRDSLQMLQAIGIGGSTPLVRVPANQTVLPKQGKKRPLLVNPLNDRCRRGIRQALKLRNSGFFVTRRI